LQIIYAPGCSLTIKLYLRRTLVLQQFYSASFEIIFSYQCLKGVAINCFLIAES